MNGYFSICEFVESLSFDRDVDFAGRLIDGERPVRCSFSALPGRASCPSYFPSSPKIVDGFVFAVGHVQPSGFLVDRDTQFLAEFFRRGFLAGDFGARDSLAFFIFGEDLLAFFVERIDRGQAAVGDVQVAVFVVLGGAANSSSSSFSNLPATSLGVLPFSRFLLFLWLRARLFLLPFLLRRPEPAHRSPVQERAGFVEHLDVVVFGSETKISPVPGSTETPQTSSLKPFLLLATVPMKGCTTAASAAELHSIAPHSNAPSAAAQPARDEKPLAYSPSHRVRSSSPSPHVNPRESLLRASLSARSFVSSRSFNPQHGGSRRVSQVCVGRAPAVWGAHRRCDTPDRMPPRGCMQRPPDRRVVRHDPGTQWGPGEPGPHERLLESGRSGPSQLTTL